MDTRLASEKALDVIDRYLRFRFEGATISVPYYNNNRKVVRAGLRGTVGKGSPRDIFDETEIAMAREKSRLGPGMVTGAAADEALKHFLVDHDIGIDCSGFVAYVLKAEFAAKGKGSLERHLKFPFSKGMLGGIRSKMRPVENADVATLAHEKNSRAVPLRDVAPADIITMISEEHDHILFIHRVDYENSLPVMVHYTHSVAWPSDGGYGHGVRQGKIEIVDPDRPLSEQKWIEADKIGTAGAGENYTFARAVKARTEIRRMLSL